MNDAFALVPINFQITLTAARELKELTAELCETDKKQYVPFIGWHEEYEEVERRLVDRGLVIGWHEHGAIPASAIQDLGGMKVIFGVTAKQASKFKDRILDFADGKFQLI